MVILEKKVEATIMRLYRGFGDSGCGVDGFQVWGSQFPGLGFRDSGLEGLRFSACS